MPGIFVAKIGLFKISSESKMEVYNCSEPHTSPHAARETRKEREKSKLAGLYIKKCSWLFESAELELSTCPELACKTDKVDGRTLTLIYL